jgi:FKBP-type peptidyl-prolyl cis-trans isomerase FklB
MGYRFVLVHSYALPRNSNQFRFALPFGQCDNTSMQKPFIAALTLFATGFLLLSHARAQQTPPATAQQPPQSTSQPAPPAKSQNPPVKKTAPVAAKSPSVLTLNTPKDKTSYAIGMNVGKSLHRDSIDIDPAILLQGLKDSLAGGKTLLTDQEAQATLTALQNDLRKKQAELRQQASETNKKEGEAFLATNKAKDGVVTLPSGLQYKILTEGTGPKPSATDSVVCNYRGTLLDGKEFDSSYKRGQPATFPVNGVIKGWTEALQLMPVGSKWQLFLPAELAYGDRGAGPDIGPNATLVFEVELLSIQPHAQPPTPPAAQPPQPATPPPAPAPSSAQPPAPPAPPPKPPSNNL